MISMGFSKSDVSLNEETGLYLVHIFYSESEDDARRMFEKVKKDLRACYFLEVK
jgi:hypothetical protein